LHPSQQALWDGRVDAYHSRLGLESRNGRNRYNVSLRANEQRDANGYMRVRCTSRPERSTRKLEPAGNIIRAASKISVASNAGAVRLDQPANGFENRTPSTT
jgi:hypothetical protein